jgi:hypothetical protein
MHQTSQPNGCLISHFAATCKPLLVGPTLLIKNHNSAFLVMISHEHSMPFEGPKLATRGGEWEPIKISSKFETSAYIPKSPQVLEPRSARIGMNKLSQGRRPRLQLGSKSERNFSNRNTADTDRSDRCTGPVWPVGQFKIRQTGLTGHAHWSDRCRPENPQTTFKSWILSKRI